MCTTTVKQLFRSLIVIPIFFTSLIQAQETSTVNAWMEAGSLRFFPTKKESGTGISLTFKMQVNRTLVSLQYHDYSDRELAHGGLGILTDRNHYHAGNFLLGITNRKCRVGHVSISSGLGLFWGEFDNISVERFTTIGWPIEAAASLNIFPFAGINLKLFTNINPKHSMIGFGMDIQLGKLKKINLNDMKL
ncbi:MAG: hypothetical protein JXB00_10020 [Bacteroidales bacterium]|nr:hypothetical protein [Bacteroidales bacterium]